MIQLFHVLPDTSPATKQAHQTQAKPKKRASFRDACHIKPLVHIRRLLSIQKVYVCISEDRKCTTYTRESHTAQSFLIWIVWSLLLLAWTKYSIYSQLHRHKVAVISVTSICHAVHIKLGEVATNGTCEHLLIIKDKASPRFRRFPTGLNQA